MACRIRGGCVLKHTGPSPQIPKEEEKWCLSASCFGRYV